MIDLFFRIFCGYWWILISRNGTKSKGFTTPVKPFNDYTANSSDFNVFLI